MAARADPSSAGAGEDAEAVEGVNVSASGISKADPALAVPAATLSFHLKELVHAGLVTQERASRHLIYRAAYERMNGLLGYLTENCCQGEPCLDAATCKC
mgnify:CR=1 FL=1